MEQLRNAKGFICDMDGVIYHGNKILPGVKEFVEWLYRENKQFLFLTNNSGKTPKELQEKLARMGLDVDEHHFYTSALATAEFISRQSPGAHAFVIGEPGLYNALYEKGITLDDTNPDYVVIGESPNYNYDNICKAVQLVQKGARLIGTNYDLTGPTEQGIMPACRAFVKPIELVTGKEAYYIGKPNELEILHGIDLTVYPGEFVAIVGESGSGKSTLMNIIGVLDKPTAGEYTLDGVNIHDAKDNQLADIRNRKIGFVFQTYNLIGRQSALKNVELPMLYAGVPGGEGTRRAKEWLERVGMGERMKHQPNELSGGQKQRVAIARAMVNEPALILADEPTGALDSQTSRTVMDLFHEMHNTYHKTIVLITHNPELADECERVLTLRDGLIVGERKGGGKRAAL